MLRDEIRNKVFSKNTEAKEAWAEIVRIYQNQSGTLKTGWEQLDYELIAGLDNSMVFIGSRPAMGKTHNCSELIRNLVDPEINPGLNVQILRINLEMTTRNLLLRELKVGLKRKMRDILQNGVTEEEYKNTVDRIVKKVIGHRNITNFSVPLIGEDFRNLIELFIEKANKFQVEGEEIVRKVVVIDHLHVYPSKEVIDNIIRICNDFKMTVPGISFIIYFQFNREVGKRWVRGKDGQLDYMNMLYTEGDIYMTDALMQYADIVAGLTIPQVVGLEEFCLVHKDRNAHLAPHFLPSNKTWVKLKGRNRIFYNFIKRRMADDFDDPTLFCEILDKAYDSKVEEAYQEKEKESHIEGPNFNQNTPAILNAQKEDLSAEEIDNLF